MNTLISLIELLYEQKIVIPIIQRDYAQGRKGKEFIRQKFLGDIKSTLEGGKSSLKLDFVYGTNIGDKFFPLDGQQRLTTLWLLCWYLVWANKSKNYTLKIRDRDLSLADILEKILSKFSYQTRASARKFCEELCNLPDLRNAELEGKKLREHIENQSWFMSAWEQDPTIQAMLNSLCGCDSPESLNKESNIADLFNSKWLNVEVERKLARLNNIRFHKLNIDSRELPISDDLYIKMNARGKPLSSFENFKADLISYLKESDKKSGKSQYSDIPALLDNKWLDVFWENRSEDKDNVYLDEIYFEFINRYILNEYMADEKTSEKNIEESPLYKGNVSYHSFDLYRDYIENAIIGIRKIFGKEFDFIKDLRRLFNEITSYKDFSFIPTYEPKDIGDESRIVSAITQPQRVIFYAICKYFELNNDIDKEKLLDWIYFARNMSARIDTIDAMMNVIRRIREYSKYCADIVTDLSRMNPNDINSGYEQEQLKEEILKAKQIMVDSSFKEPIREAENLKFTKGTIRYLFRDENGDVNWGDFEKKLSTLKDHFENNEDKKSRVPLLKIAISYCTNFYKHLWWDKFIYEYWKDDVFRRNIFLSENMYTPAHNVLMGKGEKEELCLDNFKSGDIEFEIFRYLVKSDIIDNLTKDASDSPKVFLRCRNGYYILHPSYMPSRGVIFNMPNRDVALATALRKNEIITDTKIFATCDEKNENNEPKKRYFFQGEIIEFEYTGKKYHWDFENSKDENGVYDAFSDIESFCAHYDKDIRNNS